MISTTRRLGLAAIAGAALMFGTVSAQATAIPEAPTSVDPAAAAVAAVAPMLALPANGAERGSEAATKVAQRRFRRRGRRNRARNIGRGIAIGAAIIGGAIILNQASRSRARSRDGYRVAQDGCAADFKSYSYRTDTYVTYGGVEKLCPYLRAYY